MSVSARMVVSFSVSCQRQQQELLSLNLFSGSFSRSLGGSLNTIGRSLSSFLSGSLSSLYRLLDDLCGLFDNVSSLSLLSGLVASASSERHCHSGNEHKCNLFHFSHLSF